MKLGINVEVIEQDGKVHLIFDPTKTNGLSKSGKSTVVASTLGNQTIPVKDGTVTIGFNCYIRA